MTEALHHWKNLAGKSGDVALDNRKGSNYGEKGLKVIICFSLYILCADYLFCFVTML